MVGYKILIVDDEVEYQKVVSIILSEKGYNVASCSNGKEALAYLDRNEVNLVLTDLRMPVMDGAELIERIKEDYEGLDVMVMTAYGSIESAVNAVKIGAADYFVKSGEMDDLILKVERLAKINRLERKSSILLKNQKCEKVFLESKNPEYLTLLERCKRTANSDINILLLGESGVGKEIVANYIHSLSYRREEPFIPVNCQVFPEGVIESELFGHEKGAFTGAVEMRIGRFEEANYGTLFLDELCDLPLTVQGKMLRAIEGRSIERVGGGKRLNLDIRLISATNKSPEAEIEKGNFREDLLYRVNTLTLYVPPLRRRREDLPSLIDFFVRGIEEDQKKKIEKIDEEVMDFLLDYDYPGNVRELRNIIERMIALSKGGKITINELLLPVNSKPDKEGAAPEKHTVPLKEARESFEKGYIQQALRQAGGNVRKCAQILEMSQRQLWNKITQYEINRKSNM